MILCVAYVDTCIFVYNSGMGPSTWVLTFKYTVESSYSVLSSYLSANVLVQLYLCLNTVLNACIYVCMYFYVSLSMVVINSRDRQGKLWLPKCGRKIIMFPKSSISAPLSIPKMYSNIENTHYKPSYRILKIS